MTVDYNKISGTFSNSRKNMKWEEIEYFLDFLSNNNGENLITLDVGCGSGRLLSSLEKYNIFDIKDNYTGIDASTGMIDEAKKAFPEKTFLVRDMKDINTLGEKKYDCVFFIASFHHLSSEKDRLEVLEKTYSILNEGGYIFMTNWALKSSFNSEKYKTSEQKGSLNGLGGSDFMILFGDYERYYHCFTTKEIEYLMEESGFNIIENREFDNKKNFISIVQK